MLRRCGIFLLGFGIFFSFCGDTFAAKKPEPAAPAPKDFSYSWLSEKNFEQMKKEASERGLRKISSTVELNDDMMSSDFRKFRERFLAIHSASELDDLLRQMDENYDSYPEDLKLVAANLIPLRSFRSIIYRSIPLVSKAKVTHSLLLTAVQETAQMQQIFLPTDQWKAGFDYVTQPFGSLDKQFKSMNELQEFFASVVYADLAKSAQRIAALNFSKKAVVWDNQLLYGSASFVDQVDRYRKIGEAERFAMLAGIHGSLHNISVLRAYDMEPFFRLMEGLGKLWGVSALLWNPVDGAAAENRVAKIREFPDCFRLNVNGRPWMERAFRHLQQSVYYSSLAWSELKNQPASHLQVLDSGMFRAFNREITLSLSAMEGMVKGPIEMRSFVTGKTLQVDLPSFYSNPPESLQNLLPTKFEQGPEFFQKKAAGSEEVLKYRNYLKGRAIGWEISAFKPYFPGLKNDGDVAEAARILSQAWGGGLLAAPMMPALQ